MSRRVFFLRHGAPQAMDDERRCISATDLPLSPQGEKQALQAADFLTGRGVTVLFTSPLNRCRQTAAVLGARLGLTPIVREELREVNVGKWEGLPFREIRERWPELYEERGRHIGSCPPPGGESFTAAGARLDAALRSLLSESRGNIAVVTHGGIMRGWLCGVLPCDPDLALTLRQPWGGITAVEEKDGRFDVLSIGLRPALPDAAEIRALYEKYHTPEQVILHCRAVAEQAARLAEGTGADPALLYTAALLHDLCRADGKAHPQRAAAVLDAAGWPQLAEIIGQHHDLRKDPSVEAELLALADRLTQGVEPVTVEERFAASKAKCKDDEALAAWRERYAETLRLYRKYRGDPQPSEEK